MVHGLTKLEILEEFAKMQILEPRLRPPDSGSQRMVILLHPIV
jgi:hypothetical protein